MTARMRRRTMLVACGAAVASCALGFFATSALADGPGAAAMVLRAFEGQQRGEPHFYEWTRRSGRSCISEGVDWTGGFPRPLSVEPGQRDLLLRLRWHRQPDEVVVSAWSEADGSGDPAGEPVELPVTLASHIRPDGARVWDATVSADVGEHLFLAAFVRWPDTSGCDGPRELEKHFRLTSGS